MLWDFKMKKIELTKGKYAIVDDDDYPYISRFKWTTGTEGHAVRCMKLGREGQVMLEYFIKSKGKGQRYVFKDGNPLNCTKENIQILSWGQASAFFKKTKSKTTSKYKGVCFDKRSKKWLAYITKRDENGKRVKLLWKLFDNENDAAVERNKAAIEIFGDMTYQNVII